MAKDAKGTHGYLNSHTNGHPNRNPNRHSNGNGRPHKVSSWDTTRYGSPSNIYLRTVQVLI